MQAEQTVDHSHEMRTFQHGLESRADCNFSIASQRLIYSLALALESFVVVDVTSDVVKTLTRRVISHTWLGTWSTGRRYY